MPGILVNLMIDQIRQRPRPDWNPVRNPRLIDLKGIEGTIFLYSVSLSSRIGR